MCAAPACQCPLPPRADVAANDRSISSRVGLTRAGNDGRYSASGLAAAKAALVRGGILAVWSAGDDPAFTRRLNANGFTANPNRVRARANGKGAQHTIWLAESL